MKMPLIIISLDDGSVGAFTSEEKLFYAIEAIDALNYRIFDADGFEQGLQVLRKSFLGLFWGYEMKIIHKTEASEEAMGDLIFYLTRQLDYLGIHTGGEKKDALPYLLDLLIGKKGRDKLF
ncbi:MAG: hypothetical protein ACRCWR_13435 [Saezia sp.]